ncbi:MAG: type II secretion system F family protein [Pirellulales bacterium]|nr:type II secretion system F family protein [Pirellulales bacterium]
MPGPRSPTSQHVALDDLIALADEMAALTRAGVPLERGLMQVAQDLRGRPGKLAREISRRLDAGESLLQIIETSPKAFPPTYRAVVAAGLKSGQLPSALEGLVAAARATAELRRYTRLALIYPVCVLLLAFVFFVGGLICFQPRIGRLYASMRQPTSQLNSHLTALGNSASLWAPWIPVAIVGSLALAWYLSSRATAGDPLLVKITPAGRMLHYHRFAAFSDVLALLVDRGVALGEAVTLAADSCGDKNIRTAAHQFADEVSRGATQHESLQRTKGFPPLVGWLLASGRAASALGDSLRRTASAYRRRALQLDDRLRLYMPLGLTIAVGGTAVAIYGLSMLGPWYQALIKIAGQS